MKAHQARGFTLIELLVVIAIIGVLSSVVLASLNTARGKGANAAIKGNLANVRGQAELYYDSNNSYGAAFNVAACSVTPADSSTLFKDPNISGMINAAKTAAGDSTSNRCYSSGSAWAVSVPLKVSDGNFTHWCVDSTGNSVGRTNALQTATTNCNN